MSLGLLSLPLSLCLCSGLSVGPPAWASPPGVTAATLLGDWDERRAAAWASGEPRALAELYTAGSRTGRADRAMLRAWGRHGLRVAGLRMQLLGVDVRLWSDDRVVLVVTDRLAGGIVVRPGGERVPLPRDRASTRTVTMRAVAGEWRVASVAQASPARTTSWTVRSRKT